MPPPRVARRWRKGGYVTIRNGTDATTRSASYEAGASAPFGARVVREYVRHGGRADKSERAILGLNAKRLLAKGASESDILAAVREYASTKRWPRYIAEWTTEKQIGDEIADHRKRMDSDRKEAPRTMRRLAEALREAGL